MPNLELAMGHVQKSCGQKWTRITIQNLTSSLSNDVNVFGSQDCLLVHVFTPDTTYIHTDT